MYAMITYKMAFLLYPWDSKLREQGMKAWCLVKVVTPEHGAPTEEPVAVFNWDTEAETFQGHIYASGTDGKLIDMDPDVRELFQLRAKNSARQRLSRDEAADALRAAERQGRPR